MEPKEVERPKKKYNIIKPAINDDFDKQVKNLFLSFPHNFYTVTLTDGRGPRPDEDRINSVPESFEGSRKRYHHYSRGYEEAHRGREAQDADRLRYRTVHVSESLKKMVAEQLLLLFSKADEEKARWKERRDAEAEKEMAKIEEERRGKKKVIVDEPKKVVRIHSNVLTITFLPFKELEKRAEPKRTVRKIVKDKTTAAPAAPVPSFATVSKLPSAPVQAATAPAVPKVPATASVTPKAPAQAAAAPAAATPVGAPATSIQTKASLMSFTILM